MEYIIYKYSVDTLLNRGQRDYKNKRIVCSREVFLQARIKGERRALSSLLVEQIRMMNTSLQVEKVIIELDFSECKDYFYNELKDYENGFLFEYENETISYVDFLKSNSMTKECCIFYVDQRYCDELYQRTTLGIQPEKVTLSKWYAYSGLVASQCVHICKNIHLREENVVILPDCNEKVKVNCFTAISELWILEQVKDLQKKIVGVFEPNKELKEISLTHPFFSLVTQALKYLNKKENEELVERLQWAHQFENVKVKDFPFVLIPQCTSKEARWTQVYLEDYWTEVNLFDGEGLCSMRLANRICEEMGSIHSSFQIRLPFMKGMIHSCDIQAFFKDKGITHIQGVIPEGGTKTYAAEDVDLILTQSQFKCFGYLRKLRRDIIEESNAENSLQYYFKKLAEYGYTLGISKVDTIGGRANLNAQVLSTLPLEDEDIDGLCAETVRILEEATPEEILSFAGDNYSIDRKALQISRDFYTATERYKDVRLKTLRHIKNEALLGRLPIDANVRFLSADLLALLYYAMGEKGNQELPKNSYFAPTKEETSATKAILLRNPHYSRNEIVVANRAITDKNEERAKYFGHLDGTVMVNPVSLLADRLGGADYDGDIILLIENRGKLRSVVENVGEKLLNGDGYCYPLAKIPSMQEEKRAVNYLEKLSCLERTFDSRIGLISNKAVEYACSYYGSNDLSEPFDGSMAHYTVLSGLEIDSAKTGMKPELFVSVSIFPSGAVYLDNKKLYEDTVKRKGHSDFLMEEVVGFLPVVEETADCNNLNKVACRFQEVKIARKEKSSTSVKKDYTITPIEYTELAQDFVLGYKDLAEQVRAKESKFNESQEKEGRFIFAAENIIKAKRKDISIEALLEEIQKCDKNAEADALARYCYYEGDKFHFLTLETEKRAFLKALLGEGLQEEYVRLLCDFSDEGYKLLFYLLSVLRQRRLQQERWTMVYTESAFHKIAKERLGIEGVRLSDLDKVAKEYVEKTLPRLTVEEIFSVLEEKSVFNYTPLFTVYAKALLTYLRKKEEV